MKVAIASGKGGTGKTFVSTNLFYTFRNMGISVSLVDCDAEVPNLLAFFSAIEREKNDVTQYLPVIDVSKCIFCSKCAEYCAYNAIFVVPDLKMIQLLEEMCHGCGACEVACPNNAIKESLKKVGTVRVYEIDGEKRFVEGRMETGISSPVPVIKQAIKSAEKLNTDFLIMDAPPGTSCPFIQTVAKADFVILVTEPTPFGLSDLRQAADSLKTMDIPFGVIVNRAEIGDRAVYEYLEKNNIHLFAEIPFDKDIARLYSEGKIVVGTLPEIKSIFENIVNQLMNYGNSNNKW
ncbi:MAG: P-loop NTPase [Bacteroidales bacterium]|jgi:MinD superfamily P-loop ATPase|nr:P-loop NTPase [Bacteroidales bacterium]